MQEGFEDVSSLRYDQQLLYKWTGVGHEALVDALIQSDLLMKKYFDFQTHLFDSNIVHNNTENLY